MVRHKMMFTQKAKSTSFCKIRQNIRIISKIKRKTLMISIDLYKVSFNFGNLFCVLLNLCYLCSLK